MLIAVVQMDLVWEDRPANFAAARRHGRQAAAAGAELILLPEMFATGFSMNPAVTAEEPDGPTCSFLRELATELGVAVVGGVVRRAAGGKGVNTALAVGADGRVLAEYGKTHLIAALGEAEAHVAGDAPAPFPVGGLQAACFICYDLRFPELFRLVTDRCELVLVMASWPNARQEHWDVLLRSRAIENQCYVAGCNRVGTGGGLQFAGGSAIYDPMGRALAHAGDREDVITARIDPGEVERIRAELPFLHDRRF